MCFSKRLVPHESKYEAVIISHQTFKFVGPLPCLRYGNSSIVYKALYK